ncbi:MAG: hypothetical protein QM757_08285 [Paludibaculum sp.]
MAIVATGACFSGWVECFRLYKWEGTLMDYDHLIQLLMDSSEADWLWNDPRSIWTFKPDLNITLRETQTPSDGELRPFAEKWAREYPDPDAQRLRSSSGTEPRS